MCSRESGATYAAVVRPRPIVLVSLAGAVLAVGALVWPMRAHHATWAVTVGGGEGSGQTSHVPMGGGDLVMPIQVLMTGTAPEESMTRSALRGRLVIAAAGAVVALVAGAAVGRSRRLP